jgi:hypothetical protein
MRAMSTTAEEIPPAGPETVKFESPYPEGTRRSSGSTTLFAIGMVMSV